MTTKTVLVALATKAQVFPLGTVEGQFHFQIARQSDGFVLSSVDTTSIAVSFPSVPEGDYVASASKNGVTASANFSVVATDVTFQVPDVVTVTLS